MPISDPSNTKLFGAITNAYNWANRLYRDNVPSSVRKNVSDIIDTPMPGNIAAMGKGSFQIADSLIDAAPKAGPALAMVLNPKTLNKFTRLWGDNFFELMDKIGTVNLDISNALAFIKTRYPGFYKKGATKITTEGIPSWAGGYYNRGADEIGIPEDSELPEAVNVLMHEMRHRIQETPYSKYGPTHSQLGPYPYDKAEKILAQMLRVQDDRLYDALAKSYENIPHEVDPFKAQRLGDNALALYKRLIMEATLSGRK